MSDTPPLLALDAVSFGYPARPDFLKPVSLEMRAGECWGVVGPNGAGKSTLLRLAAGLRSPGGGRVLLEDRPLASMSAIERARAIAFLPQNPPADLPLPAEDIVLMGRFPHRRMGLFEDAADRKVADDVMRLTQTSDFAARALSTLSGGEAQRVHLAAALAQKPRVMLLDEPTASLDLRHQLTIFSLLRDLARQEGLLVVVVTHDLNLAAEFCSRVLLLDNGRSIAAGPPTDVLTPDVLEPVYGVRLQRATTADGRATVLTASSAGPRTGRGAE